MGYHLRKIEKRKIGTIEKILEEVEEYQDAMEQKCEIMALVELSDIYGALELVAETHGITMSHLESMASITRRAFEDGSRTSEELIEATPDELFDRINNRFYKPVAVSEVSNKIPGETLEFPGVPLTITDENYSCACGNSDDVPFINDGVCETNFHTSQDVDQIKREIRIRELLEQFINDPNDLTVYKFTGFPNSPARVEHDPSGLSAYCEKTEDFTKNKSIALEMLAAMVIDDNDKKLHDKINTRFKAK